MRSNPLRISDLLAISIQIQETSKRSYHRIMAISQGSTRMRKSYAAISLLDDIHQKITLGVWLNIARIRRISIRHLPPDIGTYPILIQLLLGKEIIKRNLTSQLRALDRASHLIELSVQVALIDILLHPSRVVEKFLHHSAIAGMLLGKLLLCHLHTHAVLQAIQVSISLIHIVHIMLAGIMEDMELRIHAKHLMQAILHREDAADHHRASCLDIRITGKDFRKSFHHSLGNTLMLESSQRGQLTITSLRLFTNQLHLSQCFLTLGSQLTFLLRLQQGEIRYIIRLLANHIAGAMTAIVAQIERLIALRRRSQLFLRSPISHIVTARERNVSLEVLQRTLSRQWHRKC